MGRKYSITIQAHDQVSDALPKISAVVQVDGSGPPRIVELTVGAVDDGPIAPDVARNIDFALLADALGNAVSATVCSPRDEVDAPADQAHGGTSRTDQAHGDASPADRPAPERPYRRMPDAAEVEEVVRRTRSVGKLAQHYGVPRYTAQAWVNRLRRAGRLPDLDRGRATA